MRITNSQKLREIVESVAKTDHVNLGVAKARIAGESGVSVPLLEKAMRGEKILMDSQEKLIDGLERRSIHVERDELFPKVPNTYKGVYSAS